MINKYSLPNVKTIFHLGLVVFFVCCMFCMGREKKTKALTYKHDGIVWAFEAYEKHNTPAENVHIVGTTNGYLYTTITKDIIIPDEFLEYDENGNIIARHKVESLGREGVTGEDSFFSDRTYVTSSGIVVDATACTGLKTVNDWAFSQDFYGSVVEGYGGRVDIYLPDSLEKIGTNCFNENLVYCNSPNIALDGTDNTSSGFAFFGPATTPENSLQTTYKAKYRTNIPAILKDPDKFPYIGAAAKEVTLHADAPDGGEVNRGGSGLKYDSVYVFEGKEDEKSRSFGNIHPPKKEHYVFEGYFEKNTQIFDKDGVLLKVPDGMDVYAKWTPEVYQVSFRNNQNTNVQNEEHSYQEVFSPNLPENFYPTIGYKLIRWEKYSMNANGEAVGGPEKLEPETTMTVDCNSIFKAILEPITYTVSFDANGGEVKDAELPNTFDKDYSLTTASRYGYTFDGWYTAKNGGTKVTEDTQMTRAENHTLYAHWTAKSHKVVFDGNGATSGSMDDLDVTYDTKANPTCRFEKTGYSFTGWSYAKDGDVVDDLSGKVDTVIVYAIWKPNTYKVTFVTNGKSEEKYFTYDKKEVILAKTSDEYDFAGWVTDKERVIPVEKRASEPISYTPGEATWTVAKDTTLYAAWYKKPSVTLSTKYSDTTAFLGDRELNKANEVTYEYGEKISSLIMKCNTNRYIQSYRVETADGTEVSAGTCEDKNSTVTIPFPSNYTLKNNLKVYVEAVNRTYGITYDTLGGEFIGEYPKTYSYGDEFDLPTNVKKAGLYVCGWRNTLNNKVMTKVDATTSGELSLQAIYESTVYHVTTDLDGGTLPDGVTIPTEYKYKQNNIVLPQDVTKQGYSFAGWYLEDEDIIVTRIDTTKAMDYHLRALWNSNASTTKIAGTVESDGTEKEIPYAEKPMESNQWYYNQLTDVEKKIYTTIYNYYKFDMDKGECRMENVKVVTKDKITIANMYQASTAVVLDNPSIFWIRYFNHSKIELGKDNDVYSAGIYPVVGGGEKKIREDALKNKTSFESIILLLNETMKSGISIHNKILNIYGLVTKSGSVSCTKMIKMLCDYYEIPCVIVFNKNKMWNQVKINGNWYLLDASMDIGKTSNYNCFLKGRNDLKGGGYQTISNYLCDMTGKLIKEYANYEMPILSEEDYFEPQSSIQNKNAMSLPSSNPSKTIAAKAKTVTKGKVVYQASGKSAFVKKVTSKKLKKVTIQKTVTINGKKYKVTAIAKNAFKGCKKLKTITIKSVSLKKVGKNAIKGINKKAKIKVPKKYLKKYKKLFTKKAGFVKTMKVRK